MEKEFDFKEIGKQMPYRTPEGFFERMQRETLARTVDERRKKRIYKLKVGMAAVLSAAAVWCGIVFFQHTPAEPDITSTEVLLASTDDPMDMYLQQLTDEELQEWMEFSENDIFMYEE